MSPDWQLKLENSTVQDHLYAGIQVSQVSQNHQKSMFVGISSLQDFHQWFPYSYQ